jgi:hypothetical protein
VTHDDVVTSAHRTQVFREALALSEDDRLDLAAELLARSPAPGALAAGSEELAETVDARIESVRSGRVKPVPAKQAFARLRRSKRR